VVTTPVQAGARGGRGSTDFPLPSQAKCEKDAIAYKEGRDEFYGWYRIKKQMERTKLIVEAIPDVCP